MADPQFKQWGENANGFNSDLWFKIKPNVTNTFRIVTEGYVEYSAHQFKKDPHDDKDFGRKIKCSGVFLKDENSSTTRYVYQAGTCPNCDLDIIESAGKNEDGTVKPGKPGRKQHFVFGVYEYESGKYKILDIKWGVQSSLVTLKEENGPLVNYDIKIRFNPKESPNNMYKVLSGSDKPLSAEALAVIERDRNLDQILALAKIPTYDKVLADMKRVRPDIDKQLAALTSKAIIIDSENFDKKTAAVEVDTDFAAYAT